MRRAASGLLNTIIETSERTNSAERKISDDARRSEERRRSQESLRKQARLSGERKSEERRRSGERSLSNERRLSGERSSEGSRQSDEFARKAVETGRDLQLPSEQEMLRAIFEHHKIRSPQQAARLLAALKAPPGETPIPVNLVEADAWMKTLTPQAPLTGESLTP